MRRIEKKSGQMTASTYARVSARASIHDGRCTCPGHSAVANKHLGGEITGLPPVGGEKPVEMQEGMSDYVTETPLAGSIWGEASLHRSNVFCGHHGFHYG